jgi:hypothetical protein
MSEIEKELKQYKDWEGYFNNLIDLFDNGDYLNVYRSLIAYRDIFKNGYNDIKKINDSNIIYSEFLKIRIDFALDIGDKEMFNIASHEYNKLIKSN